MKDYATKKCKSCGKEFEPKRSNQVYCHVGCAREQKLLYGGGITKKGKTVTVSGALNCYLFMKDFL